MGSARYLGRTRIKDINRVLRKEKLEALTNIHELKDIRKFGLASFIGMHTGMNIYNFLHKCMCENKHLNKVMTVAEYLLLFETEIFTFVSRYFAAYVTMQKYVIVNNIKYMISDSRLVQKGDIIEFPSKGKTAYIEAYIMLFNIIHFCRFRYLKLKMLRSVFRCL